MNKLGIFIPSYRRKNKQPTFEAIPQSWIKNTFIVVDRKDSIPYKRRYGIKNILVCPEDGISKTRQWILMNSIYPYALMLDDDMQFNMRANGKLIQCGSKDMKSMFNLLQSWLDDDFVHVGISQRFGNNRIEEDYVEITRMNNAYAYNCKVMKMLYKKYGIGFSELEEKHNKRFVMEDFMVTLQLLRLGYKNRVTYKFCWSQKQSGDEGGCSLYRTSKMQELSAKTLAQEHPGLVRVVQKESKVQWKGFDSKTRYDVQIYWKKAFKKGRQKSIQSFL